jgi:CAAX prenyl protease-like protein
MNWIREALNRSPFVVRVAPYVIFVALTALQGKLGEGSQYWVYLAKTLIGAVLIWAMWPIVTEMRWAFSWEAVAVGIFVFVFWVGLDPFYPHFFKIDAVWQPLRDFGDGSALAWGIMMARVIGMTLIVPPLEEVFYRSFLYRYVVKVDFLSVPLKHFDLRAFLITAVVFGSVHGNQWPVGILCAFCYQWLVLRKGRLGDAITAHAITNLLLGSYIIWKGQWQFW